jgi:hypothetical protein
MLKPTAIRRSRNPTHRILPSRAKQPTSGKTRPTRAFFKDGGLNDCVHVCYFSLGPRVSNDLLAALVLLGTICLSAYWCGTGNGLPPARGEA